MKVWKRRAAALLTAALIAVSFFGDSGKADGVVGAGMKLFPGPLVVSATSSTQQQINEAEERRQELEEQRNENEEALEGLQGEQKDLQRKLNKLNEQLSQVAEELASLEQQIRDKEQEIADTQAALEDAKATEQWQYEGMVDRARALYEMNDESYINALLKEKSLAGILNAADYIEKVAVYEQQKMEEYRSNRIYIEEQEARLQGERNELEQLKVQAEAEKEKVSGLISQTSNSIADYGDQIEEAEERAREVEAQIKKEEENLEYLRKKLAEEIALSQAAANAAWRDISEVNFSENDRYLLANLIYCEAGAEPYAGKLAVGSVVINRVLSAKFPDSVVGVIYQKKQFSPVASGRLDLALASNKATQECYRAADEAMTGMTNVGNCVFFRTPIPGLTGISIGGHIFY
ncbi:MAG: cell wall hydrolase [Firmicutes bacterium]|nr:cell wall hydrolase [Bacillota bacterium]